MADKYAHLVKNNYCWHISLEWSLMKYNYTFSIDYFTWRQINNLQCIVWDSYNVIVVPANFALDSVQWINNYGYIYFNVCKNKQ